MARKNGEYRVYGRALLNLGMTGLATKNQEAIPYLEEAVEWYGLPDHRSYQVSFRKCREVLGFAPEWTPARGAQEIMAALQEGRASADPRTLTVSWYKTLLEWHDRLIGIAQRGRIL